MVPKIGTGLAPEVIERHETDKARF